MATYVFSVAQEAYVYTVESDTPANSLEDAIRTWVMGSGRLAADHVLWAEQTGARPLDGAAWASIKLGGMVPVAVFDEVSNHTDQTRARGTEIELRVNALRELPVRVQFFEAATVGAATAAERAFKVQASLAQPSVRAALHAVGLSPFDNGTIKNVSAILGTKFEGRAVLEMRFYVNRAVSEYVGYIETAETTDYMGPPESGTADEIDL